MIPAKFKYHRLPCVFRGHGCVCPWYAKLYRFLKGEIR